MKKAIKTLSAILLATACLVPGLAWADGDPSVTLEQSGALKASNMNAVHSALVEVSFGGDDADKVTDVSLQDVPDNALGSAVYVPNEKKAVIAVSAGDATLSLSDSLLGTLSLVAQSATAQTPITIEAKLVSLEFIDTADSSAATKAGSVDSNAIVYLNVTNSVPKPIVDDQKTPTPQTPGDDGWSLGRDGGDGNGNGADMDGANTGNGNTTTTADYRANGVVSAQQAGQSAAGGNTGLVKTGDVVLICGIGIGVAAAVVFIAMGFLRKKDAKRK